MYKSLVENYIKNLSFDTLRNYISKNYRSITNKEMEVIYEYIKNRWEEIYDEDEQVIKELKYELSKDTFIEVKKLLSTAYKFKNR